MKPPESVQIGPITYKINCSKEAIGEARMDYRDATMLGGIHYRGQSIVLDPDVGPDQLRDSLLHEVLHGVIKTCALEAEEIADERSVGALSFALLDTLRRNPKLVLFLLAPDDHLDEGDEET